MKAVQLGSYVHIRTGKLDANAANTDGEYPFFTCAIEPLRINTAAYDCECVLVAGNGDLNVKYYKGKFNAYQRTYIIESNNSHVLDVRYLYHFMSQYINPLRNLSIGGVIKYIKLQNLTEAKIPLPPLEEQKRIAAMLDKADELRRKRRESIAALDSLAQSIFLDLFGDPVTNPKKWPVSGIEHVCELIVDCVNRTAPIVEEPTPFKMIRTTNVKAGKVNLTEVRYVTEEVFNRWNRRTTPQRGDVLLTREAPVGESGIIESDDNIFLGQRLMLYRANRKRMLPAYLLALFRSAFLQHQFDRHSLGSTVKHLPLPVCRNFQVLVPPIALQNEFVKRCAAIQTQRTKLLAAQNETENLFTAFQQKAFSHEN